MFKTVIEELVRRTKCYAFTLNCTRDASHLEQMSLSIRFCNTSAGSIDEHYIGFIDAETTGEHLT